MVRNERLPVSTAAAKSASVSSSRAPSAAAATTTKISSAATAAATPVSLRAGFIYGQVLSFKILAVHSFDGCLSLSAGRHLYKAKAARLAAEPVLDNPRCVNFTEAFECLPQLIFSYPCH
jgi:hypothetical protein